MAIFVTIYTYRAHNYFITIVMKFRNYFPSSTDELLEDVSEVAVAVEYRFASKNMLSKLSLVSFFV